MKKFILIVCAFFLASCGWFSTENTEKTDANLTQNTNITQTSENSQNIITSDVYLKIKNSQKNAIISELELWFARVANTTKNSIPNRSIPVWFSIKTNTPNSIEWEYKIPNTETLISVKNNDNALNIEKLQQLDAITNFSLSDFISQQNIDNPQKNTFNILMNNVFHHKQNPPSTFTINIAEIAPSLSDNTKTTLAFPYVLFGDVNNPKIKYKTKDNTTNSIPPEAITTPDIMEDITTIPPMTAQCGEALCYMNILTNIAKNITEITITYENNREQTMQNILQNSQNFLSHIGDSMYVSEQKNEKLFSDIYFPFFRETNELEGDAWNFFYTTREKFVEKMQKSQNNSLTLHFADSGETNENYNDLTQTLEKITKNTPFQELTLKFYSFPNQAENQNFLQGIFWKNNKNLILSVDFYGTKPDKNSENEYTMYGIWFDSDYDFLPILQKIKEMILKNNSGEKISEFHLNFIETLNPLTQKNTIQNSDIFADFPAEKIFINKIPLK